jgi:ribonuclease BN (tRNA processing enzyme)
MKIVFLGVGSAFDENYPNTSVLISTDKTSLMLDCGDSAARQLWKIASGNDSIDAIYITHHHPDHYLELGRCWIECFFLKKELSH